MAEKCICCGKKIGLLNGSHLDNKLCDSCYFHIGGYLNALKESNDRLSIEKNYNLLMHKIHDAPYSETGRHELTSIINAIVKGKEDIIQIELKDKQLKEGFKITTSNSFEKFEIIKYYGIASGSTVLGTGMLSEFKASGNDFLGTENDSFSKKIEQARTSSINKMINNAISQGGNALIGVSFDYITFSSNMIGVIANGTIVEIIEI